MIKAAAAFASSRKHSQLVTTSLLVTDIVFLLVAAIIASRADHIQIVALSVAMIAIIVTLALARSYRRSFGGSMRDEWYAVAASQGLVAIPLLAIAYFDFVPGLWLSWPVVAEFTVFGFFALATSRTIVHYHRVPRRLAVIGSPEHIDFALVHLRPRADDKLLRIPVTGIESTVETENEVPSWLQGAIAWDANRVIITEELPPEIFVRLVNIATKHNISIAIALTRLRQHAYRIKTEREGDLTLIHPRKLPICTPAASIYKRIIDLVLTIPVLVLMSPILLVAAIAVKLDSPGPIIYRQTRTGKNGVPFEMLKFRSMPIDAEAQTGPVWADPNTPRATRVGRFLRRTSLDEFPQLVNVLRGEMSIVGPRPERPYFVERFRRTLPRYDDRLLVPPGITGWSQISMSRILATDDVSLKLEGDLFYLEEWSPMLDFQIIVKTAFEFLFHRVA